jgi:hypothetical protein
MPALVTLPHVSITGGHDHVSIMNAAITIASITTTGEATHESTSYLIETLSGLPVWESKRDVAGKEYKIIPPNILSANTMYRLRVLVNVTSNDSSQLSTLTFKTESRLHDLIINNLDNANSANDLVVDVLDGPDFSSVSGQLFTEVNRVTEFISNYYGTGVNHNIITIPSSVLNPATKYILRISTSNPAIWDQRQFVTAH